MRNKGEKMYQNRGSLSNVVKLLNFDTKAPFTRPSFAGNFFYVKFFFNTNLSKLPNLNGQKTFDT